jgi:hypothetical protein
VTSRGGLVRAHLHEMDMGVGAGGVGSWSYVVLELGSDLSGGCVGRVGCWWFCVVLMPGPESVDVLGGGRCAARGVGRGGLGSC